MKNLFGIVPFAFVLTACAPQQALIKPTSSGYPEGILANTTVESARSKLIDGCSSHGIMVQEASGNQVICGKTMEGGRSSARTNACREFVFNNTSAENSIHNLSDKFRCKRYCSTMD